MAASVDDVRNMIMERTYEDNEVLDELDFVDDDIEWALRRAVEYWNESLPLIQPVYEDWEDFPFTYHHSIGAAGELLLAKGHKLQRNRIPVQGEGVAGDSRARAEFYLEQGTRMIQEYRHWVSMVKANRNAASFAGIHPHPSY